MVEHLHKPPIPASFYLKYLPTISKTQLVFWDETHIRQEGGLPSRTGYCIRFLIDHNGKLCLSTNITQPPIYNEVPKKLTFKYGKEARFCLSMAVIEPESGVTKGC